MDHFKDIPKYTVRRVRLFADDNLISSMPPTKDSMSGKGSGRCAFFLRNAPPTAYLEELKKTITMYTDLLWKSWGAEIKYLGSLITADLVGMRMFKTPAARAFKDSGINPDT
jgi:hypothetical protein